MAIIITILLPGFLLLFQLIIRVDSLCKISASNGMHPVNPPFVLIEDEYKPGNYFPKNYEHANLVFLSGEQFYVVCPSPGEISIGDELFGIGNITALCLKDGTFKIIEKTVAFNEISCKRKTYDTLLRRSDRSCRNSTSYEIGYHLEDEFGFLRMMDLCRNEREARVKWVHATIQSDNEPSTRFSNAYQSSYALDRLQEGDGLKMMSKDPYEPANTYSQFQRLFGDGSSNVDKYLSPNASDGKFLARGYLIASEDKLSKREQDATYLYENMLPIWQSIYASTGNWHFVEEHVRNLVNKKSYDMDIYSGGIGTLKIEGHDLYLIDVNKLPVPKILFKCLVDHEDASGLCFLVVNNPYVEEDKLEDYIICHRMSVCEKYFGHFSITNLGYTYCCGLKGFYHAAALELGSAFKTMKKYREMWPL